MRLLAPIHATVLATFTLTACTKAPPPPPPAAKASVPLAAKKELAPPPPPSEPPDPNDAYLVAGEKRYAELYRIHGGKVTKVDLNKHLGRTNLETLDLAADGNLYIDAHKKLLRVSGGQVTELDVPMEGSRPIVGRDGSLWLMHGSFNRQPGHIWLRKGEEWLELGLPDEAAQTSIDLAVDKIGRPWLSTTNALFHRQDGAWIKLPLPPLRGFAAKLGRTYAPAIRATNEMVMIDNGGRWTEVGETALGKRSYYNFESPEERGDGGLITADPDTHVTLLAVGGKVEKRLTLKGKVYGRPTSDVHAKAVDAQGRIWITTDNGLVIVTPNGKSETYEQWEPGRVPGFERFVAQRIFVGGKGPELPTLLPKVRGEITGHLAVSAPVAVEMCDGGVGFSLSPGVGKFYGATPCAYHAMRWSGRTDAQGNFRFTGVTPYQMSVVFKENSRSWAIRHPKCCTDLRAEGVRDLGPM